MAKPLRNTLEYEIELILEGSKTVLSEGFSPGGIFKAVLSVKATPEEAASPLFAHAVSKLADDILRENVRIKIKPLSPLAEVPRKGTA